MEKFRKLGISEETLKKLEKKGFENPSPIQEKAIPVLLEGGTNIVGQAETGTGKTAAFGIPIVEKIKVHTGITQALIVTPTRELALQVAQEIESFVSNKDIKVATIYGGQAYNNQIRSLKKGADIVVGTPGRLIDHLDKGTLKIDKLQYLILDEADEMLNMGFIEDIKKILSSTNDDKNMLLFSATMPKSILQIAKKYMGDYQNISIKKEQLTTTQTDQIYFEVNERDKFEALSRIIDIEPDFFGIVFCKTKIDVDKIAFRLSEKGYNVEALHGDIEQKQRERIIKRFKSKNLSIIVATDVAARGIDINDITHVINYSLPQDPESYVHRVGRTGRAGKKGTAITFVTPSEYKKILFFKKVTKTGIRLEKIPDIKSVVLAKKNTIKSNLKDYIDNDNYKKNLEFAKDILSEVSPDQAVAGLLSLAFEDYLNEDTYKELSKVKIDKVGKTRLFIALGRNNGYSPRGLIDYVSDIANINPKDIKELKMMNDFSFITVSFENAEMIIHSFDKIRKSGQRSLVSKAKERRSSSNSKPSNTRKNYRRSYKR